MKTKLGLSGLLGAGLAGAYLARKKLQGMAPKLPEVSPETVLLFQFAYSPYCIKVQHALRYKQIDFEVVELLPIVHSAYTQKVSGQPKVPYIQHRGQIIADSSAIVSYLETLKPEPALLPADNSQREHVLLLEDWLDEALQPALARLTYTYNALHPQALIHSPISTGLPWLDRFKPVLIPVLLRRSMRKQGLTGAMLPALEARAREVLNHLQALLKDRTYLVGEQLSLADLTLFAHLSVLDKLPMLQTAAELQWLRDWQSRMLTILESK